MPGKIALAGRNKILDRGIKIAEANLPSWLTEAALNARFVTQTELDERVPMAGQDWILMSPDGTRWKISIENDGALTATLTE